MNGSQVALAWQVKLVQIVCYSLIMCSSLALILIGASRTQCSHFGPFDFHSLTNSTKSAEKKVKLLRNNDVHTPNIYFDSATMQLPTYSQIRCEVLAHQNKRDLNSSVRSRLMQLMSASENEYELLFVANPLEAVRFIGEGMRETKVVVDFRTHFDTMSIRKFVNNENVSVYNATSELPNALFDKDSLFVLSLEDSFNGDTFPFDIPNYRDLFGKVRILADATTYVPNSLLNVSVWPFDAVIIDFRRLFGTVDLAALLIKKEFLGTMSVLYRPCKDLVYALVTADKEKGCSGSYETVQVRRSELVSLECGLDLLEIIGYQELTERLSEYRRRLYKALQWLSYSQGRPKCQVYGTENGAGIVSFNMLTRDGNFVPGNVVLEKLSPKFTVSYGCHGAFGSCSKSLGITENEMYQYLSEKMDDSGEPDMLEKMPVGAVRVSLGWLTTENDIRDLIEFVTEFNM